MPSHALRNLDTPAVRQVVRYPRGAERVAPNRGFNSPIDRTAAHHAPDIPAQYRPRGELRRLADRGAEHQPLAVARNAGSGLLWANLPNQNGERLAR